MSFSSKRGKKVNSTSWWDIFFQINFFFHDYSSTWNINLLKRVETRSIIFFLHALYSFNFPSTATSVPLNNKVIYIIDPGRKTLPFKIYFRSMVAPSWKINFTSLPYPFSMIPNAPLIFRSASYATKMDRVHFPWYRIPLHPRHHYVSATHQTENLFLPISYSGRLSNRP